MPSDMQDALLQLESVGKRYRIGETLNPADRKLKTLFEQALQASFGLWRTSIPTKEFWALRDVSFSVQRGEAIAIIGRNGSGKTTLLKLISRLTHPTEGSIKLRGRIGSYLGIGAGIHPEMTGRENIIVSAGLLGMPKRGIKQKMEQIIDFAELSHFIDTPVKFYSSGMQARLAFSVATFLDRGDILIIDEALATGDMAFTAKCLACIREMVQGGQTVLFTTHGMGQVHELATRCLYLKEGRMVLDSEPTEVVRRYESDVGMTHAEPKRDAIPLPA